MLPSSASGTLDFEKTLQTADAFFGLHGQPWALAGAAALSSYRLARATQDLDFVYVGGDTSRRLFEECREAVFSCGPVRVPRPEHLAAMKVQAMKNDPERRLQDLADVRFLMDVPGVNEQEIRGYFQRAGLLRDFDELRRTP